MIFTSYVSDLYGPPLHNFIEPSNFCELTIIPVTEVYEDSNPTKRSKKKQTPDNLPSTDFNKIDELLNKYVKSPNPDVDNLSPHEINHTLTNLPTANHTYIKSQEFDEPLCENDKSTISVLKIKPPEIEAVDFPNTNQSNEPTVNIIINDQAPSNLEPQKPTANFAYINCQKFDELLSEHVKSSISVPKIKPPGIKANDLTITNQSYEPTVNNINNNQLPTNPEPPKPAPINFIPAYVLALLVTLLVCFFFGILAVAFIAVGKEKRNSRTVAKRWMIISIIVSICGIIISAIVLTVIFTLDLPKDLIVILG